MKLKYYLLFISFLSVLSFSVFAEDIERGKTLHDENCITCHSKMYPGDGSGIYTRENRRIETLDGLYMQVNRCKDSLGFKWPEDQIEDLVTYLNKTYYKFED